MVGGARLVVCTVYERGCPKVREIRKSRTMFVEAVLNLFSSCGLDLISADDEDAASNVYVEPRACGALCLARQ